MKKSLQNFLLLSVTLLASGVSKAQSFSTNVEESSIRWYGEEITGKTHFGSLKFKDGTLNIQNSIVSGGIFIVDMTSLSVEDLSGGGKAKLEGHLKSDDFFSVEKHNEAVLKITQKGKAIGDTQTLIGNLTIKGIEHPIEFIFNLKDNNTASAELTFNRSEYDVRFRSGSFFENLGDKLILDDIKLEVNLALKN